MLFKSTGKKIQPARYLFESNRTPMFVIDHETHAFLDVNDAALSYYGYSRKEFLSKTMLDIQATEEFAQFADGVRWDKVRNTPCASRHQKRDGSIIHVQALGDEITFDSRRAVLVTIHDVSDRIRLQERLRQCQSVEATGRLAGGVAHDFNNLLTVISGHAAMLSEDITDPEIVSKVHEIQKAAARATSLTRQLLTFSGKSLLQQKIVNPNRVVRAAGETIARLVGEHIEVQTALFPDVVSVRVDPVEMEQVLVNLAVNAGDAMPCGGLLMIKTETIVVEEDQRQSQLQLQPGRYVLLSVCDTGCGMTEKIKRRLFEPFFTTKPQGQGTGLGLWTVYAIVKQVGGSIAVDSEPGKGTTFRIYLPGAENIREPDQHQKQSTREMLDATA